MKIKPLAALAAITLALAGCDSGPSPAGAGVDARDGSGASRSSAVTGTTDLSSAKTRGVISETPLLPLATRAAQAMVPDPENFDYGQLACAFASGGLDIDEMIESLGYPLDEAIAPVQQLLRGDHAAICAAYGVILTTRPHGGWPNSIHEVIRGDARQFMSDELAMSLASAELLAPIAEEMAEMPGMPESEALEQIRLRIAARAPIWIETLRREASTPRSYRPDATGGGSAPVHYTTGDGYDVALGPGGAVVVHHGTPWFGAGYLHGTMHTISIDQGNTVTIGRSQATASSRSTETTEGVSANVQTQ